jgi:hypothetical protein
MKNNRRDFLKISSLLGIGVSSGLASCGNETARSSPAFVHKQAFNMSGYIAPKLETVRIGIIGIGNRGTGTTRRLASIEGVEIKALCDLEADKVNNAIEIIKPMGHNPDAYSGGPEEWKKVCDRKDIDLIAVVTPWDLHTPICVYAMENDKHAYTELPAATSIEECWQLIETSERTKKHCVQMSGSCHSGIYAVVLNMARQGYFGDLIHAEGAYVHQLDLLIRHLGQELPKENRLWRLHDNTGRHGNLYPQHGLVPIIQMMNINYGDKMDYLVSVSSNDFTMNKHAKILSGENDYWKPFVGRDYRGNINTSIIKTHKGRTITMVHDVSSPRPAVRFHMLSGSDGIFESSSGTTGQKQGILGRLSKSHHDGWLPNEEFNSLVKQYTPEITKKFEELVNQQKFDRPKHTYSVVSPTDWRLIDCLRTGLPMDMDVYEAAVSSAVIPLSIWSAQNQSTSIPVPDFTSGAWASNQRGMDIQLEKGFGSTKLV